MSNQISREAFVAAMKRKDVKILGGAILREIFNETDEDKIKELETATRVTVALIDRTCVIQEVEESGDEAGAAAVVGGGDTPKNYDQNYK